MKGGNHSMLIQLVERVDSPIMTLAEFTAEVDYAARIHPSLRRYDFVEGDKRFVAIQVSPEMPTQLYRVFSFDV